MPEARAALASGGGVSVEPGRWLVFRPADREPTVGYAFYPGGRVPVEAYAPMAREIARTGYLVVLMPMPLNLAVLDAGEAGEVAEAFPEIGRWAVGGHSLGGVAAASYAHDNPASVRGLVLLAAYPQDSVDLSARGDLAVASISGTRDGVLSEEGLEASVRRLPRVTARVRIEGGNHAQFGWYGPQVGDGEATITRREQQERVVAATLGVLREVSGHRCRGGQQERAGRPGRSPLRCVRRSRTGVRIMARAQRCVG